MSTSDENALHHQRRRRKYGSARTKKCIECGGQALDWAYQHTDPEPKTDSLGALYSLEDSHYLPMCRKCHKALDHRMDPSVLEAWEERRWRLTREDQVKGGKASHPPGRSFSHEEAVSMGHAGGTRRSERMRSDPELMGRMVENALRNLPRGKRTCLDCGLETTVPGMGNHLKHSGHSGYRKG